MPGLSWTAGFVSDKKYVTSLKYTQINPGDKETPTPYKSWSYQASEIAGFLHTTTIQHPARSWESSRYRVAGRVPLDGSQYYAASYEFNPTTLTDFQEALRLANSRVRKQVQEQSYTDFNAAVFLGEAGEAIEMITSIAQRVSKSISAVKRGDLRGMTRALGVKPKRKHRRDMPDRDAVSRNAAGYYLEYMWGVLPLLVDAQSAAEKVAHTILDKPEIYRAVGTGRRTRSATSFISEMEGKTPITETEEVSVRVELRYTVSSPALQMAASLGLTNPAAVAWELAPFSCVADWFVPIGNFLESFSTFDGLSFKMGLQTVKGKRVYTMAASRVQTIRYAGWANGAWNTAATTETLQNGSYVTKESGFRRYVLTNFPRPAFPPMGKGISSVQRALLALSVIQVVTGK